MIDNDQIDILLDLKHNLGKYLRLPFSMLEKDATEADLKDALRRSLLETRSLNGKTTSAKELWDSFIEEANGCFDDRGSMATLMESVEKAFSLEKLLLAGSPMDQAKIGKTLSAVGECIQLLIEEVTDDT